MVGQAFREKEVEEPATISAARVRAEVRKVFVEATEVVAKVDRALPPRVKEACPEITEALARAMVPKNIADVKVAVIGA